MNYDERIKIVSGWVFEFLGRFKSPDGLSTDAIKAEMVEIAEAINSRLPSSLHRDAVRERLTALGREVNMKHKTRAWPQVYEFMEAFDRLAKGAAGAGHSDEVEAFMLERCEDWHAKFHEPMPSCVPEDRAVALLKRGNCGTAREMYEAGYHLPKHITDNMGPPTPEAMRKHDDIMAYLRSISGRAA